MTLSRFSLLYLSCSVIFISCSPTNDVATQSAEASEPNTVQNTVPAPKYFQNGQDWPKFLGPDSNATSAETGILTQWPPEGPPVIWSRAIGESYGAPVVSRGRLIMFHRIGDQEVIESIDALDGKTVHWKHTYPTNYVDQYGYNGGPRSSATIDGDHVYTFGAEGVLTSLDFETGKLNWQRQVNQDFHVHPGFFGVGVAPVIEDNLILLNVGGPDGAGVVAFEKSTGETVWTSSDDTASYSTPIVGTIRGERLAIFHSGDGLLVLEVKTGEIRYQYPFRSRVRESAIAATPLLIDDTVFLSATYKIGAALFKLTPEGLEVTWKDPKAMQNHWAISVYQDGYLYGLDGRHESSANFRCIDYKTGEVIWTTRAKIGRAAFIQVDGHLIALGERGHLVLIELSPEKYIEKARIQILDYPSWTPPILAQGYLYIRNEKKLLCLDIRKL